MKKSEMIKSLAGMLITLDSNIKPSNYEEKAKNILDILLYWGMLPPTARSGHSGEYHPWEEYSEELRACEITPGWEPEHNE